MGIVLKDRHVSADPASAPAGEVTFDIRNEGPQRHELVVIRTDLPENELPTEGEGGFETTVDEKAKELEIVDEQEDMLADTSATLTVDLEAGSYVLICNIGGHYLGGMHTAFSVA